MIMGGVDAFVLQAPKRPNPLSPMMLTLSGLHSKRNNDSADGERSILSRFTAPKIDDPALPLSDGLVTQVIAPSLQIGARLALHIPPPTWLQSTDPSLLYNNRPGGLLAPTLLHGAALSVTWIIGALAAKAYERPAISPIKTKRRQQQQASGNNNGITNSKDNNNSWDYSRVWLALFQSGAVATGIWILATQIDVYMDVGTYVQWGDSIETDGRLIIAATEGIADFVFEAVTIIIWRFYLAYQTERLNIQE
jgi:hypothetical protein